MITVTDDTQARQILDEIGAYQRAVGDGTFLDVAGNEIVARLDAVMNYLGPSTSAYTHLVEPVFEWAVYSLSPKWIDPAADPLHAPKYRDVYNKINAVHEKYAYLKSAG